MRFSRKSTSVRITVLSLALLSAAALSPLASVTSAQAADPGVAPTASTSNPNPINATPAGQMMNMQTAAMQNSAQSNASADSAFDGNVPKSTSLSANFAWADTFDASALNGGYGGGVTVTRWITAHSGLNMNIEILSFGLGKLNNVASPSLPAQAGTPIIPITLGYVYDVTGGQSWINPQVFADGGLAVTLNGESAPLVADMGVGVTTPLAKLSDALAGINLFANIRWAYVSNIGGLADTAVAADNAVSNGGDALGSHPVGANNAAMNYMPIEFGATFVF